MKSKSGAPKGSKNASKGGRGEHITARVPENLKHAVEHLAKALTEIGEKKTTSDVINDAIRHYVHIVCPEIAEEFDL